MRKIFGDLESIKIDIRVERVLRWVVEGCWGVDRGM